MKTLRCRWFDDVDYDDDGGDDDGGDDDDDDVNRYIVFFLSFSLSISIKCAIQLEKIERNGWYEAICLIKSSNKSCFFFFFFFDEHF